MENPNRLIKIVALILVAFLCLVMRLSVLQLTGLQNTLRADALEYFGYAYNLAENGTYSKEPSSDTGEMQPDFVRSPGFPFFASSFFSGDLNEFINNVLYAQLFLNALVILAVMLLGWKFFGFWPTFTLSLLYATSPHIINMNMYFLSESLMISLVVVLSALMYLVARNTSIAIWAGTGLILACASLTRPYLQYFIFLFLPYLFFEFGKQNLRKMLALALGFMILTVPWSIYKTMHGNNGAEHIMVGSLHHGMYPNIEYNDIAETRGYPYRFDPNAEQISADMPSVLAEIARRFKTEPGRHLYWYLIGKPLTLWQWSMIQGTREIYIYNVTTPPWDYLPHFQVSYFVHKFLHYPLLIAAVLFAIAVWIPRVTGNMLSRENKLFFRSISLMLIYGTLIHMVAAPFPRYQIPQLFPMYIMALGFFGYLAPELIKRFKSPENGPAGKQ